MCPPPAERPRVGISACLLGEPVRYDGRHKRDAYLADELSQQVEWVPVCPEVEIGLGTPREPIQLVRFGGGGVRLVRVDGSRDLTEQMEYYARRRVDELKGIQLSGYVFKSKSPSCGVTTTPVHAADGSIAEYAAGLFAAAVRRDWPELPLEEEIRLRDERVRAEFLDRVLALHRAASC